jgi:hypothetical protein
VPQGKACSAISTVCAARTNASRADVRAEQRRCDALLGFMATICPACRMPSSISLAEPHSDYVIWPAGTRPPCRRDLRANDLGRIIVDRALGLSGIAAIGESSALIARDAWRRIGSKPLGSRSRFPLFRELGHSFETLAKSNNSCRTSGNRSAAPAPEGIRHVRGNARFSTGGRRCSCAACPEGFSAREHRFTADLFRRRARAGAAPGNDQSSLPR